MRITMDNCKLGNEAMAWYLLLYYQLITEKGFSGGDMTVYLDPDRIDPFDFLNSEIDDNLEIDIEIINQGSIIYLLCDLYDVLIEYEDNEEYKLNYYYKKIYKSTNEGLFTKIPEVLPLIKALHENENGKLLNSIYEQFNDIYKKYVYNKIKILID